MKVALCLSGHVRTYKKTVESFKRHLADRYDSSVFIHTWNTTSAGAENVSSIIDIDDVVKSYSPVEIVAEPQRKLSLDHNPVLTTARNPPNNVYSKSFSTKSSINLALEWSKAKNVKFDTIVSLRSDMLFYSDVVINDNSRTLFLPGNVGGPYGSVHDYFAFGDESVMTVYAELFDHFNKVVSQMNVARFRAEHAMCHYLLMRKVPISYCSIDYALVRVSGEVRRMKGFDQHEQLGSLYHF